ncbi:hypothetical protein ACSQ67_002389 [Phaseolus vulgaris]
MERQRETGMEVESGEEIVGGSARGQRGQRERGNANSEECILPAKNHDSITGNSHDHISSVTGTRNFDSGRRKVKIVSAFQFPLISNCDTSGDMCLHLFQDAVSGNPRPENWISWFLLEGGKNSCGLLYDGCFNNILLSFVYSIGRPFYGSTAVLCAYCRHTKWEFVLTISSEPLTQICSTILLIIFYLLLKLSGAFAINPHSECHYMKFKLLLMMGDLANVIALSKFFEHDDAFESELRC